MKLEARRRLPGAAVLVAFLLFALAERTNGQDAETLLVVVNKYNSAAAELNKAAMKKILLGDKAQWQNGAQIAVIFRPPGDADRAAVLHTFCNIDEGVFTRRQMQASFSGGAPVVVREVQSPMEVKSALKSSPWAVGFLHKKDLDDSVKVVMPVE
jgi:hypothetical protein